MYVPVALVALISIAFAAPIEEGKDIVDTQRTKKSSGYGAPCAGPPLSPVSLYLAPQGPALLPPPLLPHYREDEHKENEHMKHQARAYYEVPSSSSASASASVSVGPVAPHSVASGPAVGIFPRANTGNCAVPLLLSCSPNVVSGHLAPTAHAAYTAPAYRSNSDFAKGMRRSEQAWEEAERAAAEHNMKVDLTKSMKHSEHAWQNAERDAALHQMMAANFPMTMRHPEKAWENERDAALKMNAGGVPRGMRHSDHAWEEAERVAQHKLTLAEEAQIQHQIEKQTQLNEANLKTQ